MAQLTVLAAGVDSLYLSFQGQPEPELLATLDSLKTQAQADGAAVPISFEDRTATVVQPFGWGFYRYWAHSSDFDAFVAAGANMPGAYVRISSEYLHSTGPDAAADRAIGFVARCLFQPVKPPSVSRIDVFADFQGWAPVLEDFDRLITRSVNNHAYHEPSDTAQSGRRFSGFRFGKGAIVARLYDKTLEISRSGKGWMRDVWGNRMDANAAVWRLEFQFRREGIADFNLAAVAEVLAARRDLWRYGLRWLSLRQPTPDTQRSHWPVDPIWHELDVAPVGPPMTGVIRQRVRERQEAVLVRGLSGYLTSLAALWGVWDLNRTAELGASRVDAHFADRQTTFGRVVADKRVRLV